MMPRAMRELLAARAMWKKSTLLSPSGVESKELPITRSPTAVTATPRAAGHEVAPKYEVAARPTALQTPTSLEIAVAVDSLTND
jgi:hypothetical protein